MEVIIRNLIFFIIGKLILQMFLKTGPFAIISKTNFYTLLSLVLIKFMSLPWENNNYLELSENQLTIDGVSAIELAEKYDTPLFIFSENRIQHNIKRFKKAGQTIDCPLKICYAAKANSNMAILETIRRGGSDLEVNSGGELFKALKAGFRGSQIIFNGTSKTEKEIKEAIEADIYAIQADSIFEVELIQKVARSLNKRANVSLRLVPEIETDTLHGLQTALLTSKFGMMPDEALMAFDKWTRGDAHLNLCGIHLHIGSQNPKSEPYIQALVALFENLLAIFKKTGHKLSHLNLGGGFPVNYLRDDNNAADISANQKALFSASLEPSGVIGSAWKAVQKAACQLNAENLLENLELLIEPGRSIIADTGICLTKVRNKKERPIKGQKPGFKHPVSGNLNTDKWLLTDAGFNILLSMETYKWYYHLISAERAGETHLTPYKVAGPLCDGGDVYFDIEGQKRLPDYRLLPKNIEVGEVLALFNCGAYSIAQMFPYNGRELPNIVLIQQNGEVKLIRKKDSYQDLMINDLF
jgi:diaminopimelate decarboxylase